MAHILTRLFAALSLILVAGASLAQSEYRIQPGDTLAIEVLEDSTLNRSVVVLPDGRFSFPFAGSLPAAGRTVSQVQSDIAQAIQSNYATRPTVFVSAQPADRPAVTGPSAAATIDVYFLGEVGTPGLRPVAPGTTFLQALAQAGGFTPFAATKRIQLHRTDPRTGQQVVQSFNYKALSRGAQLLQDTPLRDGDVILVPERRLFE
jgi:polysaccharide export outer membrane protein